MTVAVEDAPERRFPPAREVLGRALLKSGVGAARYRLTGHRMPLSVTLAVTNRCNALCSYCAVPMRRRNELDTHELMALVDHLAGLGTARIGFAGGEPLVRRDLPALVDRCAEHGIWTAIETNGYLYPQRADELARASHLLFALDGRPESHDRARERGSHKKVTAAIREAAGRGAHFGTVTVLGKHNLDDVDWILDLADELRFDAGFQVLQPHGALGSRGAIRLMASDAEFRKAIRRILEAKLAGRRVGTSEKYLRYLLTWDDFGRIWTDSPHEDVLCLAGQVHCAIDADGSVYTCLPRAGADPAGNVRTDGFEAAFERLRDNRCRACTSTACTETNFLYNLNGPSVFEMARSLARGTPSRGAP